TCAATHGCGTDRASAPFRHHGECRFRGRAGGRAIRDWWKSILPSRPHHPARHPRPRRRGDRMIGRREAIALMGNASLAWPLAAPAQPSAMPVVAYLGTSNLDASAPFLTALRVGLKESGYVEGRGVAFAYRWAEGRYEQFPALAAELVALKVAVIVAPN